MEITGKTTINLLLSCLEYLVQIIGPTITLSFAFMHVKINIHNKTKFHPEIKRKEYKVYFAQACFKPFVTIKIFVFITITHISC